MSNEINPEVLIPDGPDAEERRLQLKKEEAQRKKLEREAYCTRQTESYHYRVQAVVETALAYYRRGAAIQYDSTELVDTSSRKGGIGSRRATDNISPEDATADMPCYTVCSTLPYNLYQEVIGFAMGMGPNECACAYHYQLTDQSIVYHWMENHGESREEMVQTVSRILRPGDVITAGKSSEHAIMYLGDCLGDGCNYCLHSWGSKYNMLTGKDSYESMGTMRLQTFQELMATHGNNEYYRENKIPRWNLYGDMRHVVILRPLRIYQEDQYPLTANALARLAHPGLNIDRRASLNPYHSLPLGGQITYTVTVENHSRTDYTDITVFEPIPAGTKLVSAPGARQEADGLHWVLSIPAGGSAAAVFTVQHVSGTWIEAKGGNVAGIRSNCLRSFVRNVAKESCGKTPQEVCEKMGIDPTRFCLELVEPTPELPELYRLPKDPDPRLVPKFYGGKKLITYSNTNRILEFSTGYLMEGDLLLRKKGELTESYLWLNGQLIGQTGPVEDANATLWESFIYDLFFCIRQTI